MTSITASNDRKKPSLKTYQFLHEIHFDEQPTKRTFIALEYFIEANPKIDLKTYFTDFRLLHGKKLIEKQDQATTSFKNFITFLENKSLSANTITCYRSDIKKMHDDFYMELPIAAWRQIMKKQKHTGNTFQTTSPTKLQIQRILSNATALEKAYFLTVLCTGKRPTDILKIDLGDLHLDEKPPRITFRIRNTKTKRRTPYAFITDECKEAIQTYLTQRQKFIERITNSNLPIKNKERFSHSTKLYPMVDRTIRERWNILLDKADLNETASNGNGIKRHKFNHYSLKYYFRTYLGNPDLAEHLMGHTDIRNLYSNKQEHEIAADYVKSSKNLYIYSNQNTDDKIIQELKDKDEQIQRLITSDEIKKQQLSDMQRELDKISEIMVRTGQEPKNFIKIDDAIYFWDDEIEIYSLRANRKDSHPPQYLDKNKIPLIESKDH